MAKVKELEWKPDNSYEYHSMSDAQKALEKEKAFWDDSSMHDQENALSFKLFDIRDELKKMDIDISRKYGWNSIQYGIIIEQNDYIDKRVYDYLNYETSWNACDNGVKKIPSFHSLATSKQVPEFGGTYQFKYSYPMYNFKITEHKTSHKEEIGTGKYNASYDSISDKVTITRETQTVRVDDYKCILHKSKRMVEVTITFTIYAFKKGGLEELEKKITEFNNSKESKTYIEYNKMEKGSKTTITTNIRELEKQIAKNNEEISKMKKDFEYAKRHRKDVRLPLILWTIVNIAIIAIYAYSMFANIKLNDISTITYVFLFGACILSIILGVIYLNQSYKACFKVDGHAQFLVSDMPIVMYSIPISIGSSIIVVALLGFIWNNTLAVTGGKQDVYMKSTLVPLIIIAIICLIICYKQYCPKTSLKEAEKLIANRERTLNSQSASATNSIKSLNNKATEQRKQFDAAQKSGEWKNTKEKVKEIADYYASIRL